MTKWKRPLALLIILLGLSSMAYPVLSSLWSFRQSTERVEAMEEKLSHVSREEKRKWEERGRSEREGHDPEGASILDPFEESNRALYGDTMEDAFGLIFIPKLGMKNYLFLGATETNLWKGIAQVEGTDLPLGGVGRRSVLAGHRGTERINTMFRNMDSLERGDLVYLYTPKGRLIYSLKNFEIIEPTENEKLLPLKGKDMVTLLTCHPFPTTEKRLLANCERREDLEGQSLPMAQEIRQVEKDTPPNGVVRQVTMRNKSLGTVLLGVWVITFLLLLRELGRVFRRKKK